MDIFLPHNYLPHSIKPVYCGFLDCYSGYSYGPAIRDFYLIHYVMRGKGVFSSKDIKYHLSEGQCFLIVPDEVTFYKADEAEPWFYIWIAFKGENINSLLNRVGLCNGNPVFANDKIKDIFNNLYFKMKSNELDTNNIDINIILTIYSLINALPHSDNSTMQKDNYVNKIINYIASLYNTKISVESLSKYIGLDRRYLGRIFKSKTGYTIQNYIINYKMQKAKDLLCNTKFSIGNVARSVGYNDVYNFSNMFKKACGKSPTEFRKNEA